MSEELDGPEEGLWALDRLTDGGVDVLNGSKALLIAHDKLLTARILRAAALPHPRTILVRRHHELPDIDFPAVLKPRFGSWGRDVLLCHDRAELERAPWRRSLSARGSARPAFSPKS